MLYKMERENLIWPFSCTFLAIAYLSNHHGAVKG